MDTIIGLVGIAVLFGAYLAPAIVASVRGNTNWGAVMVIDLLLGWTIIGWIVALVMASAG